jgi:hypothetical protein
MKAVADYSRAFKGRFFVTSLSDVLGIKIYISPAPRFLRTAGW